MFLRCVNPFLSESFFCFHLYSRFVLFYLSFLILLWFSTFVSLPNFSVLKIQKEKEDFYHVKGSSIPINLRTRVFEENPIFDIYSENFISNLI